MGPLRLTRRALGLGVSIAGLGLSAAAPEPIPARAVAAAMASKAAALFPQVAAVHAARAGHAVVAPKVVSFTKPNYPMLDRVIERQGEVWVGFIVGPDGTVTEAKALSETDPPMARAAVEGVRHWKFQPGTVDGRPDNFLVTVPVRFQLPHDSLKG